MVLGKAQCYGCHSANFAKLDEQEPERSKGYFGGGNRLFDMAGRAVYSANLTPDRDFGIGGWTEDQFVRAVRHGIRPDGRPLRAPMLPYRDLTDDEARAAFAYLQSVPRLRSAPRKTVPRTAINPAMTSQTLIEGASLYAKYSCASCHGDTGVGYGDLRGADRKYLTDAALATWIARPADHQPGAKMPTYDGIIAPAEYRSVVAYVRALGRAATGR